MQAVFAGAMVHEYLAEVLGPESKGPKPKTEAARDREKRLKRRSRGIRASSENDSRALMR
jgi:hypothetical protein